MDLVLDISNFRIKGAFFEGDILIEPFKVPPTAEALAGVISNQSIGRAVISSVNQEAYQTVATLFDEKGIPHLTVDLYSLDLVLDVDEPEAVGQDRVANCYGALHRFPQSDCVIVDLGTAVTFDSVSSNGHYLGGAIYPGIEIQSKALNHYTSLLPDVAVAKPEEATAKTTETHIQSGLYYGLLGAVERVTFELRQSYPTPSDVKVLATGGIFQEPIGEEFIQDIQDLVDLIDPMLTLVGIHEIMKENT